MAKKKNGEPTTAIVAKITPKGGKQKTFLYRSFTPSGAIVADSTAATGIVLEPVYFEEVTRTVKRSKWLGAGLKFGIQIAKVGKFEFEKKPTKETDRITKTILRHPQKR